ncbi:MAG: site-specific DNA-methyltransferase [Clostridiales bacterium]|nr:site-specific DNA-methyltransferase [Clostridiales bacterium]
MEYPVVQKQTYGNPNGTFLLCDVVSAAEDLKRDYAEQADLIYLDPPFYTNQKYAVKQRVGTAGYTGKKDYLLSVENDFDTFADLNAYEDYLTSLLTTAHAMLKKTGSIYIHVDFRASYLVRKVVDEIFGQDNLLNEIVWHYRSGGRAKRFYSRKHDTIFFYKKRRYPYFDPDAVGMLRGEERRNNMKKSVDEDGRVYYSIHSAGKEYRYYADSVIYPDDVWSDISHLQQKDPERTGYPTQKPMALLQRIIRASCPPDGLVVDLCSGSGTTAMAAASCGRRYLVADQCPLAMGHLRSRLLQAGEGFSIQSGENAANRTALHYALGRDGNDYLISLEDYRILGYDNPYAQADHGTLSQLSLESYGITSGGGGDLSLLDYAAVGYVYEGELTFCNAVCRSPKHPMLEQLLRLTPGRGMPVVAVGDVFGNNSIYPIIE